MNTEKIKIRKFYLLSFLLPFSITLLLFIINGIFPFGDTTFLKKDFYQQYTPFFYEFYRKLKNGDSLFYSWNAGIGANFFAVFVYYLASPFNLLSLLLPEKYILEFMSYMVLLKTGLMGLTMSHYLRRHFDKTDLSITVFGMAYAFSGFMCAYNWNVMWMEVLVMAPLTILGLEYIHKGQKPYMYCLALAYSIFTNYYLSIMLCMYLVIYFIVLSIKQGFKFSSFFRFGWYSLLAGAFGAVLMLPELAALQFTSFTSSKFPKKLEIYQNWLEVLGRHLIGIETEQGLDHWPNIYAGLFTLFLVALYFATRRVSLKDKILNGIVILFFILSFNINFLNYIWHGLNYPDSLPARQTYLYCLLLITIAYEGYQHILDSGRLAFFTSIAITVIFIAVVLIFDHDDALSVETIIFNAGFGIVMAAILTLLRFSASHPKDLRMTYVLFSVVMVIELSVNSFDINGRSISRKGYFSSYDDYKKLNLTVNSVNIDNNDPLGRVDEIKRKIRNNSMIIDFSSLSCFSSTTNGLIKKYCDRYGLMNSRVFYLNEGVTPISAAIMGQHFTMVPEGAVWASEDIADEIDNKGNSKLYELKYTLPAGYVLRNSDKLFTSTASCDEILSGDLKGYGYGNDPLIIQNDLGHELGLESDLFSLIQNVDGSGKTAEIVYPEDCHLYLYDSKKTDKDLLLKYSDSKDSSEVKYSSKKYKYVFDLGYHKAGTKVTLKVDEDSTSSFDLRVYKFNNDSAQKFIDIINSNEKLENIVKTDSALSGTIDMKSDGRLVLQIPYEKGWTLYVDGNEQEIDLFDSLYISTELSEGLHTIEVKFYPEGLNLGLLISAASVILILISFFIERKIKTNELQV